MSAHGYSRYVHHSCRCEVCRQAASDYRKGTREARARAAGRKVRSDAITHHRARVAMLGRWPRGDRDLAEAKRDLRFAVTERDLREAIKGGIPFTEDQLTELLDLIQAEIENTKEVSA